LLFGVLTETFPASGDTGPWACYEPTGQSLAVISTPTVQTIAGEKWELNLRTDQDGYRFGGSFADPIPVEGASIVAAVIPKRFGSPADFQVVVDIFHDRLCLVVRNGDGLVGVRRNSNWGTDWAPGGTEIPDGQITILSLVVQTNGTYKVWANGTQIMDIASNGDFVSLRPNHDGSQPGPGDWGWDGGFTHYINVGRNNPDGWTTLNGNIGDVFVYKVALGDTERTQLESDLYTKFMSMARTVVKPVTDIQTTTVTLNGELLSEGVGGSTVVTACYGTVDAGDVYANWQNKVLVGNPVAVGLFSKGITGLSAGTTYHYTFYAINTAGATFSDVSGSFSTADVPSLSNRPAASVYVSSARARGYLVLTGFAATTVKLYHGATDGGTTPGSWDVEMDLGVKDAGLLDVLLSGISGSITTGSMQKTPPAAPGRAAQNHSQPLQRLTRRVMVRY